MSPSLASSSIRPLTSWTRRVPARHLYENMDLLKAETNADMIRAMHLDFNPIAHLIAVYIHFLHLDAADRHPHAHLFARSRRDHNITVIRVHHDFGLSVY